MTKRKMMKLKVQFGRETRSHIEAMSRHKLRRKIVDDLGAAEMGELSRQA